MPATMSQSTVAPKDDSTIQETQFVTSPEEPVTVHTNLDVAAGSGPVANPRTQGYGTVPQNELSAQDSSQSDTIIRSSMASSKPARVLAPDLLRGLLMLLQAIDHSAMSAGAWPHGSAIDSESDGGIVTKWNRPIAWVCRALTHLCAPGFMFLLGMGIVYFGKSRSKLGWSGWRMVKHFFVRGVVLALVNTVLGLVLTRRLIELNIVLLALAINYFLAGLLWLALDWTERGLASLLEPLTATSESGHDEDELRQRLLRVSEQSHTTQVASFSPKDRAATISFHIHNIFLLAFSGIAIWWNIWFSPFHAHCSPSTSSAPLLPTSPISNPIFTFFFLIYKSEYLLSVFPPLAWISFAILGLLYARLVLGPPTTTHKQTTPIRTNLYNLLTGLAFLVLFVLTRLLDFGNLSTNCLQMPEQRANPAHNPYTLNLQSFMYVTKYPPSPSFAFYTLSVIFLSLSALGFIPANIAATLPVSVLLTYGTCALFFYAVHLPLYGLIGTIMKMIFGREMEWDDPFGRGPGLKAIGVPVGIYWVDYLIGLVILWWLCRWYGRFKATKGPDSVWRFF